MSTKSTWKNNADIKLELEKLHRCGVTHMDKLRILNRKFGLNYKSVTTIRRMLEYFEIQRFDEIPLLTVRTILFVVEFNLRAWLPHKRHQGDGGKQNDLFSVELRSFITRS